MISSAGAEVPPQTPALPAHIAGFDPPPAWLIHNVTRWLPLIERWHPDFPDLDPALVLAVMAAESQGFPYIVSSAGAVGLMQVLPRSWVGTVEQLEDPAYNLWVGMKMLDFSVRKWGLRGGLARYNCSEESVLNDGCGSYGGLNYADRVINYWLPIFQAELFVIAGEEERYAEWLAGLGYGEGLGKLDRKTRQEEA